MNHVHGYKLLHLPMYINQNFFHNNRPNNTNHYDTLKLTPTCSNKEIRNAFIKLSKQYHPDVNKHPKAHLDFLQIREAYKVLSKPESRQLYDLTLNHQHKFINVYSNSYNAASKGRHPADDPFFYPNRDKSKDAENSKQPYYGIKGIKRVSNGLIALICVGVAVTAFTIQMTLIRFTVAHHNNNIEKRSYQAQEILNEVKEQANRNGNLIQLKILAQRIENDKKKGIF